MRGSGRTAAVLAVVTLFAGACDLVGGSTSQTASTSPETSPSSTTTNPVTSSPVTTVPSPESTPSSAGLAITSLPVHNGEVGIGYLAVTFLATGGTGPYAWAVAGGTFPPGLALSNAGVVTGNNSTAGNYPFSVKVTDSTGQVATGTSAIRVFPALSVTQPCANVCYVGFGCTTCGRFGVLSGGAGPYHYNVISGTVPQGMALNGFSLTGPFTVPTGPTVPVDVIGPPVRPFFNLAVQVTDDFGASRTVTANWLLFGPISLACTTGVVCTTCFNSPCTDTAIQYALGSPSDSVSVVVVKACFNDPNQNFAYVCSGQPSDVGGYLPPNWSATAKAGVVTVHFDCANSCNQFTGDVYFALVDHGACVAPQYAESATLADVNINYVP